MAVGLTGVAEFIGNHTVAELFERGYRIVIEYDLARMCESSWCWQPQSPNDYESKE